MLRDDFDGGDFRVLIREGRRTGNPWSRHVHLELLLYDRAQHWSLVDIFYDPTTFWLVPLVVAVPMELLRGTARGGKSPPPSSSSQSWDP